MNERWQPVPVPLGDGRHDVGDEVRAAIAQRLIEDFGRLPDLTQQQVHHLALFAAASVRSLLHELGTLHDMSTDPSVPLSAIRALVQQWRKDVIYYDQSAKKYDDVKCDTAAYFANLHANQLAALCPAPPEDQT